MKTRAERREEIATRILAAMWTNPERGPSWESCVSAAMTGAELLIGALDDAATNDKRGGGEPLSTIGLQQELIGDLLHENQRMLTFVEKVRELRIAWPGSMSFWAGVMAALDEFDSNVSTETQQKGGE